MVDKNKFYVYRCIQYYVIINKVYHIISTFNVICINCFIALMRFTFHVLCAYAPSKALFT